jgi:hypothetical protein
MCAKIVFCLQQWSSGKRRALKFRTPLIWREPQNHHVTSATFALLTLTRLILEIEINGHTLTWFRSNDLFHIQVKHQHYHQRVLN